MFLARAISYYVAPCVTVSFPGRTAFTDGLSGTTVVYVGGDMITSIYLCAPPPSANGTELKFPFTSSSMVQVFVNLGLPTMCVRSLCSKYKLRKLVVHVVIMMLHISMSFIGWVLKHSTIRLR